MKRTLAPAAVLCLASLLPCSISAQQTASPPPPLPKAAVALLQLAWQQHGLHGPGIQPWHVRATWTEVDDKGQATDTGTWEEWWAGENKYKISYTNGTFQQSLFVTDHGLFVSGSADAPSWAFARVQEAMTSPIPELQHHSKSSWHEQGKSVARSRSPAPSSLLCRRFQRCLPAPVTSIVLRTNCLPCVCTSAPEARRPWIPWSASREDTSRAKFVSWRLVSRKLILRSIKSSVCHRSPMLILHRLKAQYRPV